MRPVLLSLVLCLSLAGVSACGGGGSSSSGDSKMKVIDVTFTGKSVTPNGARVEVGVNQPIEFVVKADQAGEMHVHSSPEKELKYAAGTTTLTMTLDKPGLVEVESHALDKTIVQLEVK